MVTFRSNDPEQQPGARPSVAGMRVARKAPDPQEELLEPADSFDLGDEASSAEEAAGVWLGRKAAAKAKKKKAAAKPAEQQNTQGASSLDDGARRTPRRSFSRKGVASATSLQVEGQAAQPTDAAEAASAGARPQRKGSVAKARPKRNRKKVLAIVGASVAAVLVACAVVAGFWAWDTWYRYDDAADIQGEWATSDGSAIVVIDSETMHMPDSVDFAYTLDTKDKTIAYSFGDLQGGGAYVFSDDRSTLTITEADGSLTVFVKRSSDTTGEARVVSAAEAAASAAQSDAVQAETNAQAAGDSPSDAVSPVDDNAIAPELSEQEASEVADALNSTSDVEAPGANAVAPGSNAVGAQ